MAIVHLMIPDFFPSNGLCGTAAYACDRDRARGISAPMWQRTLDPAEATCIDCRTEAELDAALIPIRAEKLSAEAAAERLPKHLRKAFWARQVKRYRDEQLAREGKLREAPDER